MTREKLAAEVKRKVGIIADLLDSADAMSDRAVVSRQISRAMAALEELEGSLLAALDAPAQLWREFAATHDEPNVEPIKHEELPRHQPALTDAAIAEQRWQARHAQPVHRPAKLSGYSKDLRVESAQPVHPEPPLWAAATLDTPEHVLSELDCWCRPYRDTQEPTVIIHQRNEA